MPVVRKDQCSMERRIEEATISPCRVVPIMLGLRERKKMCSLGTDERTGANYAHRPARTSHVNCS
jgi:hypothetical protein